MNFANFVSLAALLSLQISSVLAAPVAEAEAVDTSFGLEKRVGKDQGKGTEKDPYIFNIDCDSVEEVCEAQCAAILCFKSPSVLQYGGEGSSDTRRTESGANSSPFKKPLAKLVGNPPKEIDLSALGQSSWISPEDTTVASAKQGGKGTLIAPVKVSHNKKEGSRYNGQLSHYKTEKDEWFKKMYFNAGKYCKALTDGKAADTVCKNVPASDPVNFMFRRTSQKSGNSILWQHLKYGTDTWAVNFPGY
ncbi:hypothetical protein NHQ30_004509 [Ciborinia camelliae]|nr:hypothetical protein NHQ30_004509 [Ciborinia camelliae]